VALSLLHPRPPAGRRRRPSILLAAVLGAFGLVSVPVRGAVALAQDNPLSYVSTPAAGAQLAAGTAVTVRGGASNGEAGGILRVELSLDGGATWQLTTPSPTTENWSYTFTPAQPAVLTLVSRAATATAVESPTRSVTVTVAQPGRTIVCPCTLNWPTPAYGVHDEDDEQPVELGLRFMSSRNGYVTGVLFSRYADNTGPHVAHLWDSMGNLLAEQTLDSTGDAYPYVRFDQPVPITAGSVYTASYYTPSGHYASSEYYFSTSYWDYSPPYQTPLTWVPPGEAPDNWAGVYHYGDGGGFPSETWHASNYWVQPVFTTG
jgi:hypothetical protein